ncbi:MAG: hypothetical protein PSU94_01870 [Lacunisphaera sp.]|nr:hypothetical protein [Lacunisphaera sp.]
MQRIVRLEKDYRWTMKRPGTRAVLPEGGAVKHAAAKIPSPGCRHRPLWLFATLWSLRRYPSSSREWTWAHKFAAVRKAGFIGVFSPPNPALAERGTLRYLAGSSLDAAAKVSPTLRAAKKLGAMAIDIQLGSYSTSLPDALTLVRKIRDTALDLALPFAIETHRGTFTETPEATLALSMAFQRATGERLPLCLDHSHFAVVRHLVPGTFWARLRHPLELSANAEQFHLRPFNGHHCQIPVLNQRGRRAPEYQDWLADYAVGLFSYLSAQRTATPLLVVAEMGHAEPAYGLSCFGDTWRDVQQLAVDLRRQWRVAGGMAAAH